MYSAELNVLLGEAVLLLFDNVAHIIRIGHICLQSIAYFPLILQDTAIHTQKDTTTEICIAAQLLNGYPFFAFCCSNAKSKQWKMIPNIVYIVCIGYTLTPTQAQTPIDTFP